SAVLETARAHMEPYEWAFWMEGKPAEKDIKAPDGTLLEKAGSVRDGGSYEARMGAVACWNAVMDQNDYMVRKWNEFIAAGVRRGAPPPFRRSSRALRRAPSCLPPTAGLRRRSRRSNTRALSAP